MGTSNFLYKNASRVYAISMPYEAPKEDDDGNEIDGETEMIYPEREDYEADRDYVRENMKEVKDYDFRELSGSPAYNPRSFEGSLIGQWGISKQYAGVDVEVIIIACSRSGYYEGACLDWYIETYVGGYEIDTVDNDSFSYYGNVNAGLSKIFADKANKWIDKMKHNMPIDLEKVFAESCGMQLKAVATFSNGETIYETVK